MSAKHAFPRYGGSGSRGRAVVLTVYMAWMCAGAAAAQEAPGAPGMNLPVVEDTLANGMRILVLRRPGAPTVSFALRFDAGSVDEASGQRGIAHFLEHLLFKGTTTIGTENRKRELELLPRVDAAESSLAQAIALGTDPSLQGWLRNQVMALRDSAGSLEIANEFTQILLDNGARSVNAVTSYESTTYYMRLPSNRAELWFVMEADRMANPVFRGFYAERDVLAEERETRVESSATGKLMEAFYGAAYGEHPYGAPVMGTMADIAGYERIQALQYHERFYGPNNAVAVVVGDVEPQEILEWARKYFGPITARPRPPRPAVEEPRQGGERRVEVLFPAEPQMVVGWHVADGYSPDMPALAVLSQLLAGGRTSRLYRRLVLREKMAAWVGSSIGPAFRYAQLLMVNAQPLAGFSSADVEEAIYDELARILREPPTSQELERVRNQLEVNEVRRLISDQGLAFQLAESAAYYGDWREAFRYGERITAVTAEDVVRVARRYVRPENRTVATLVTPVAAGTSTESGR